MTKVEESKKVMWLFLQIDYVRMDEWNEENEDEVKNYAHYVIERQGRKLNLNENFEWQRKIKEIVNEKKVWEEEKWMRKQKNWISDEPT